MPTLPRSEALRLLISYVQSTDRLRLDSPGAGQAFATRLLTDPEFLDHGIGGIAIKAGFGDLSYFTRSFRRVF